MPRSEFVQSPWGRHGKLRKDWRRNVCLFSQLGVESVKRFAAEEARIGALCDTGAVPGAPPDISPFIWFPSDERIGNVVHNFQDQAGALSDLRRELRADCVGSLGPDMQFVSRSIPLAQVLQGIGLPEYPCSKIAAY